MSGAGWATSWPGLCGTRGPSGWSSFGAKAGKVPESCDGMVTPSPGASMRHQTRSWVKSAGTVRARGLKCGMSEGLAIVQPHLWRPSLAWVSVVTPAVPVPRLHPGGFPAATPAVSLSPAFPLPPIFINSLAKDIESACRFADDLTSAGITPSLTPGGCVFTPRDEPSVLRRPALSLWAGSYPDRGGACGLRAGPGYFSPKYKEDGLRSHSAVSAPSLPQTSFHSAASAPTFYF